MERRQPAPFYIWLDDEHRPRRLLRHTIGADAADALVHEEADPASSSGSAQPRIVAPPCSIVHDHETSEISLIDRPIPAPRHRARRAPRDRARLHRRPPRRPAHHPDQPDGAEDYRIVEAPVATPGREHWREIEPHRPGRLILDVDRSTRTFSSGSSARTACRASSCATSPTARSTRSPSTRRPTRSACPPATNTTPTGLALHLFVDDDAGRGVRLRHEHARADAAQDARRSPAATIPRAT